MVSFSEDKQTDIIDAFNTTSRYLNDILNIYNVYFENMVSQIYSSKLHVNETSTSDTQATLLNLRLSISNGIFCITTYHTRDNFDSEIFYFSCLDGDVFRSTSYGDTSNLLEHLAMLLTSTLSINF